ncbi:phage minor head protein [Treponema sp.]|uniref:phage minor head protein n=1 Tax=Treponema sp. TaxID=166 RepID=UPI00388DD6C0
MPDDELRKMERYLSGIFSQAEKDLIQKSLKYMADFERKDKAKLKKVENGEITDDEYKEWRKNQLLYGEHWTRLIQLVQKEMVNVNQTALDYINDKTTQIYADSYNSIATVIKQSPVEGYSFELVDANTVKNLAKEEGIILPPKKNLDVQKDKLWNAKQVNAQLLQGILQGEDIPHIAGRMAKVCESNKSASIRNARTMVTAAENSGRQSGMNKAESDGIIFKKMWIATRDERTRESHMVLNGQLVNNGEKFVTINGDEIEFPGDWRAKASEVYNCRCTLGTIVTGFKKVKLEETIEKQEEVKPEQPEITQERRKLSDEVRTLIDDNIKSNLTPKQYQKLIEKLENNPLQADLLSKYGSKVNEFVYDNAHAYWHPSYQELHWSVSQHPEKAEFSTLFHELGHAYDQYLQSDNVSYGELQKLKSANLIPETFFKTNFALLPSSSDEFLEAMRKDIGLVKEIIDTGDRDKINPMVTGHTSGIQDFISGALGYDPKYRGEVSWQHSEKYYNRKYDKLKMFNSAADLKEKFKDIEMKFKTEKEMKRYVRQFETASELWANINSANGCGGDTLTLMKTYCPNSYEAYMKIMEGQK